MRSPLQAGFVSSGRQQECYALWCRAFDPGEEMLAEIPWTHELGTSARRTRVTSQLRLTGCPFCELLAMRWAKVAV